MGLFDPVVSDEQSFRLLQRTTERIRQLPEGEPAGQRRDLSYPVPSLVQVWTTSGSPAVGDILQANADGLHPGRIRTLKGTTWSSQLNVWIKFVDWEADSGAVYAEHGRYFVGTLAGSAYSTTSKPLYLCQAGAPTFLAQHASGLTKGTAGSFKLYHRSSETDSTFTQTATPLGAAITANKWVTVQRLFGGKWYAGCWET